MNWLRQISSRRRLFVDLTEEIAQPLEEKVEALMAEGVSRKEAEARARREFGNVTRITERGREPWVWAKVENLIADLRFALRRLTKSPVFALTAIVTLALGIGATTALFSIVNGVLLKPLAYRESGRLVIVWERVRFLEKLFPYVGPNPRHVDVWQKQASMFSDMSLLQVNSVGVGRGTDHPQLMGRVVAQPNLLSVLGVHPAMGRDFLPEEGTDGHQNIGIISWRLWQSLFHGESDVIGKTVLLSGSPYEVVGVLPQEFYFPKGNEMGSTLQTRQMPEVDLITPTAIHPDNYGWNSDYGNYFVIGHLRPGVSIVQAQEQLNGLGYEIARQAPPNQIDGDPKGAIGAYVQPLKDAIVGKTAARLWLLLAAVASVLLIACVNLANAQLARFAARDREAAVRSALGASSGRLLQSAVAEVLVLSVTGGWLGVGLAYLAVHWFSRYAKVAIPRMNAVEIDLRVLGLSVALTVGASLAFGVLPALRMMRVRPQEVLKGSGHVTGSRWSNFLRRGLVGVQVLFCTTLLLVAGLFAKSLIKLSTFDKGFSTDHVVAADLLLQGKTFTNEARVSYDDGVLEKLRSLPGVQSAALVSSLLEGETWIDGVAPVDGTDGRTVQQANYRWISSGYFTVLQQKILAGRALNEHDRGTTNAVISEATARAVWPGREAVGRQFKRNGETSTVVGVARDAHNNSLRDAPPNMVYLPYWANPPYTTHFLVRGSQEPSLLINAMREAIWSYNPDVTIARIKTLNAQVSDSLASEHMETWVLVTFGGAALLLAILGIYGTLSYAVEARTQEVGIRMALGATRASVYGLMLGTVIAPVLVGLVLGWLVSLGIGRSVAALLYDTTSTDVTVVLSVACLFAAAAAVATFVPCRHAAMIEPMEALRAE